jgi:hypothetical protein
MNTVADSQIECARCGNLRDPGDFYARLGRRHKECKECSRAIARENRRARLEGRVPQPATAGPTGVYKLCVNCQEDKDTSEFHVNAANADGLHSYCKSCRSELWEAYSAQRKANA